MKNRVSIVPVRLALTLILFLSAGIVRAQLIDVNFTTNSLFISGGGYQFGPTMTNAAVLGQAGDKWNGINVSSGTGIPLIYANGSNSPVTMTFTSAGGYNVFSYGGKTPFTNTPYVNLMQNYLYNGNIASQTITLSNLAATSMYNLVLYNAADTAGANRTTWFTVNSNTQSSTWNGTSSNLIGGVDYAQFTSARSDGSGKLVITWNGTNNAEGDINGFQIQSIVQTAQTDYWLTANSMLAARANHTATLLTNGEVLVAGGIGTNGIALAIAGAELYDASNSTWAATGPLNTARAFHTATLLPDGHVLVVGGYENYKSALASAELYDPASGTWTNTGSLNTPRWSHLATLLPNGKVLVLGGINSSGNLNSAELYDPSTGTWTNTGSLSDARFQSTVTVLPNGKALVTGGSAEGGTYLASSELYDPASGTWTNTGSLNTARGYHSASLLTNGMVLVTGGLALVPGGSGASSQVAGAELYNPASGRWTPTGPMNTGRWSFTSTTLSNSLVLVAGGYTTNTTCSAGAELYIPADGTWANTGPLNTGRALHTATLLSDGQVLAAGGYASSGVTNSVELYGPPPPPPPPPPVVTNTNDNGPGSLREVITDVPSGETITFAPGFAGTITLSSGPIVINKSLNIIGPSPKTTFISTANTSVSFQLTGGNVFLSGLTISHCGNFSGNPAIVNGANLTVSNCEVIDNPGPSIDNSNSLVLLDSSFIENGPVLISSNATASATNCTFANDFGNQGGAIFNQGTLTLVSCTVAWNDSGSAGGAIYSTGTVYIGNSAVAENYGYPGGVFTIEDVAGNFTSLGYNFIEASDGSTGFINGVNNDQVGTAASPLNADFSYYVITAYNGGQTMNVMPLLGSPLIDQGNSFGLAIDQRGFARTIDFSQIANPPGGDGTDIGAVEYGASLPCSDCATQVTIDASQALRPADSRWFGANTVAWKSNFDNSNTASLMREMGCTTLRFPGGSYADTYHWYQNSNPTQFTNFIHVATNVPTPNVIITVNYGTGTSNEAAGWVANANITNNCGFKYWEVGNENYYSGEADQNTNPPYAANDSWTYAMRFCDYYHAMKAVDPTIKVGAVVTPGEDTYDGPHEALNPRTGIYHEGWDPVVFNTLKTNGVTPDFLIHHVYPEYGTESDPELLQFTVNWAFDAAELRQEVSDYFGSGGTNIELLCTENNADADYSQGRQSTSLVNGVYLADSLGHLMQTEFNSWLWWLFQDGADTSGNFSPSLYGWRTYGDYGLALNINTRYPTFYAFKLMHDFVQPGDTLLDTGPGYPFLDVFSAISTNGILNVLVINKDPTNTFTRQLTLANFSPNSAATVCSYGMPQDDAAETNAPLATQDIATNQMTVAGGGFTYAFPPYSLTLFTFVPTGPSLAVSKPAANSVIVSWPWPSTGWTLKQSTSLTTSNWTTPPETVQNDGTNNFIIITSPPGSIFFRLQHL